MNEDADNGADEAGAETDTAGKLKSAALYAVLAVAAVVIIALAVTDGGDTSRPAAPERPARAPILPADAGTVDEGAERAWRRALAQRQIDPAPYSAVYVQDTRTYTAILTGRDDPALPAYVVTIERGSNRVLDIALPTARSNP